MLRMKEILQQQKLRNDEMLHVYTPKFNRPELEPFRPCEADGTVGKVEPEKIKFTDREGEQ